MKKLIFMLIFIISIALTGCEQPNYIDITTNMYRFSSSNSIIDIDVDYEFIDFSKTYEDGKCTVILNYNKKNIDSDK